MWFWLVDENTGLHICSWKREEYFNSFFPLQIIMDILIWFYTKTWQVVVSWRLITMQNLKPYQGILRTVTLKSIDLLCTLDGSFTHARFCNITCWSLGKYQYTELYRCSKCWRISLYKNLKLHSLILPPISSELSIRKLSYFQWWFQVFQKLSFQVKIWILSLATGTDHCYSWSCGFNVFILENKMTASI